MFKIRIRDKIDDFMREKIHLAIFTMFFGVVFFIAYHILYGNISIDDLIAYLLSLVSLIFILYVQFLHSNDKVVARQREILRLERKFELEKHKEERILLIFDVYTAVLRSNFEEFDGKKSGIPRLYDDISDYISVIQDNFTDAVIESDSTKVFSIVQRLNLAFLCRSIAVTALKNSDNNELYFEKIREVKAILQELATPLKEKRESREKDD
ncbi:hypothetical protein [Staphylococcus felis]|nr:hypothetical protein [Staphylococcus felis]